MKIIAFGASYSKNSINKKFANYAAKQLEGTIELLDLNDFQLPLYTIDYEQENGIPEAAKIFTDKILGSDIVVISLAEHNGSYTAGFKNIFDWSSRVNIKIFENKKMLLLSTATGPRGGNSVLLHALDRFPRHGAEIIEHYSLPSFNQNFNTEEGIINQELLQDFLNVLENFKQHL